VNSRTDANAREDAGPEPGKDGTRLVTSHDVARLAGVSQSTVSRTFSRSDLVSQETRDRVLAVANELAYQPSAIARSLSTRQTNIIGIVMADITSPFYPYVLEKFTARLQEMGRRVLLFNAAPHQDVDEILPLVQQYRVDALIVTSATLSSAMAEECIRQGTPVIMFNRHVLGSSASAVCCDNTEGARLAANVLLDSDHRRLAYIAGSPNTSTNAEREKGFFDRLRERGIANAPRAQAAYTYDSGYEAALHLLDQDDPPDAIFCANDIMAMGAIDAARHLGIAVPDEVSIMGFDDIPAAEWAAYRLTTIRQCVSRMIEASLELLHAQIEDPTLLSVLKLIPGELIIRESVRGLSRTSREASWSR
jgi:DNA-binding LacI/PurR family transcriptional regulator